MKKTCKVEGCNGKYIAKGYCTKHYQQVRHHGELRPETEKLKSDGCKVKDCKDKHHGKGYCRKHYLEERNRERRLPGFDRSNDKGCEVKDCNGFHVAKGYCKKHYKQIKKHGRLRLDLESGPREYHGMWKSRAYKSWLAMRIRCLNINNPAYPDYGGRGITICNRWDLFSNFYKDMGPRPEKTSIERINNNLGYFPGNCRWSSQRDQVINRRMSRNNTSGVTGVYSCHPQSGWAARITINYKYIYLGTFTDKQEAIAAREAAELKYFGFLLRDKRKVA